MQEFDSAERVKTIDIVLLDRSRITVPLQTITTMGEMKEFIANQSGMRIDDLKLVRNGRKVRQLDNVPIADLDITEKDAFILLSYEPRTTTQTTNKRSNKMVPSQSSMGSLKQMKTTKQNREKIDPSIFSAIHVQKILKTILASDFFRENSERIITDKQYWDKMCKIMCQNNKFMSEIFQKEKRFIINQLIEAEPQIKTDRPKEPLRKTIDEQIIQQLSSLEYQRQEVMTAVQMSENNIQRALNILQNGKQSQFFTIQPPAQADQQLFIFRWLTNHQNRILRIKFCLDHKYLDIYLNSVKHRCPDLFNLLLKHKKYLRKIIGRPYNILMES